MIIKTKYSAIIKAKKAGAKVIRLYMDSSTHQCYEGRIKRQGDYFYGIKAVCDNDELLCLKCDNPEEKIFN